MMRNFKMVERFQLVVGYGVSLWIVCVLFFYMDLLNVSMFNKVMPLSVLSEMNFTDTKTLCILGLTTFLVLLSLGNYYSYVKKKGIDVRKKIGFFYWLLASSLLALLVFRFIDYQHFYFLALSLALFVSMSILLIKNIALAELLHLVLLGGIFYYQFGDRLALGF